MKRDPAMLYMMPFIMGPQYDKTSLPQIEYPHIETVAIQYKTHRNAAVALVPECFVVDDEPIVTVTFTYNSELGWAGGAYALATFQISARFDGKRDHVKGDYILVMYENETQPILGGREYLGIPKLYADIPPIKTMSDGSLRCEVSLYGNSLFCIEVAPLKKQDIAVRTAVSRQVNERPGLAYKYIPALDGPPDADYPTITRNDIFIDHLWMGGQAKLYFNSPTLAEFRVIEALKTLDILSVENVLHFQGSAMLRFDQSHRLL